MAASQAITDQASVARLFDRSAFSSTGYPHLQAVFERMATASLDSLRDLIAHPPQYTLRTVQAEPLGDVLEAIGNDGIAAVFFVPEWQSRLVFAINRALVYAIVEMVFGGDGTEPPFEEVRPFSQIERNVARAVLTAAAKALQASLASVSHLTFAFERIETSSESLTIDDRNSRAVVARFDLRAVDRSGELMLVIPQSAVQSTRSKAGEAAAQAPADPAANGWLRQMQNEIRNTEVTLTAVLDERRTTLAEVARLKVGQLLRLEARVDGTVRLECNNHPLFNCEIGQLEGAYTLRVAEMLDPPPEAGKRKN